MRRGNYTTFYALFMSLIFLLIIAFQRLWIFLKEVYYHRAWKEFLISTFFLVIITVGFFTYYSVEELTPYIAFLISFTVYCIYWHFFFNKDIGNYFNKNWVNENWWWTLNGWEFEEEVAKIFRMYGYEARVTKKTGDGGIDIILKKDGGRCICQCKHYHDPIGPEPVRALYGVKDDFGADNVLMIASSGLTYSGMKFIENKDDYGLMTLEDIIGLAEGLKEVT